MSAPVAGSCGCGVEGLASPVRWLNPVVRRTLLFSYGTLRLPEVQRATFGMEVPGEPDEVVGHRLVDVTIDDAEVVALSGSAIHPALVPDPSPEAAVIGTVFAVTDEQLARADEYEVEAYHRIKVRLRSGRSAWVFALRQGPV